MIKHIAAVAVVLTSSVAYAGAGNARYELKRIPMGPRPDHYVLVRADRATAGTERPYALTGDTRAQVQRNTPRYTPLHPKGTHGPF
jgi:hypothetical protein